MIKWSYGRLTITRELKPRITPSWQKKRIVECLCECWLSCVVWYYNLRSWNTKSCWCIPSKWIDVKPWDKYGRLTVLEETNRRWVKKSRAFLCECDCWRNKIAVLEAMRNWKCKSCWCLADESSRSTIHWMTWTRPYSIWQWMKLRCKTVKSYMELGHCDERNKFEKFWNDMKEGYSDQLTLDRIDGTKWYSKDNCRRLTPYEQSRNLKSNVWFEYEWKKMILTDWCDYLWLDRKKVHRRKSNWWSIPQALELENR